MEFVLFECSICLKRPRFFHYDHKIKKMTFQEFEVFISDGIRIGFVENLGEEVYRCALLSAFTQEQHS